MYEQFFGIEKCPFSMTPDPSTLYLTDGHREAIAGLNYAIMQRKGFVVLTGEAGTGKTTLLRKLMEMLPESDVITSVVLNPLLTPREFIELLMLDFGIPSPPRSKARRLTLLAQTLIDAHRAGKTAVLFLDEAHKLTFEVLEEIRLLTNFETSSQKLLQIVLAGQPELVDLLNRQDLWQLKQRIAIRLQTHPLSRDQVAKYIDHRWTKAGGNDKPPLTEDAISLVALKSMGIPRLVNAICDNALLFAFGAGTHVVTPRLVGEVVRDLDLDRWVAPKGRETGNESSTNGPGMNGSVMNGSASNASAANGSMDSAPTPAAWQGMRGIRNGKAADGTILKAETESVRS
jgi:general secretion pathway protein A